MHGDVPTATAVEAHAVGEWRVSITATSREDLNGRFGKVQAIFKDLDPVRVGVEVDFVDGSTRTQVRVKMENLKSSWNTSDQVLRDFSVFLQVEAKIEKYLKAHPAATRKTVYIKIGDEAKIMTYNHQVSCPRLCLFTKLSS